MASSTDRTGDVEEHDAARAVVCDSDTVSARFLSRALSRSGLDVAACHTAAECERLVDQTHPVLVVLSILLPDLDGLALARRLRTPADGAPRPRIVMVSVLQAEQRALEAGADAFLLKPVAPTALEALVSRLLVASA